MSAVLAVHQVSLAPFRGPFGLWLAAYQASKLGVGLQLLPIVGNTRWALKAIPQKLVVAYEDGAWNHATLLMAIRRWQAERRGQSSFRSQDTTFLQGEGTWLDWLLFGNNPAHTDRRVGVLQELFSKALRISHEVKRGCSFELHPGPDFVHGLSVAEMVARAETLTLDYKHLVRGAYGYKGRTLFPGREELLSFLRHLPPKKIGAVHIGLDSPSVLEQWGLGYDVGGFSEFVRILAGKIASIDRPVPVVIEVSPVNGGLIPLLVESLRSAFWI